MFFTPGLRLRLIWGAAVTFVLFIVLCVIAVQHPETLDDIDDWVDLSPDTWRGDADWLHDPLIFVSHAFGTLAMTVYTAVAAALLALRKHYRTAVWVIATMSVALLLSTAFKALVDRPRPTYDDPLVTYTNGALPSGHAVGISAAAGIAMVLALLFVRKRPMRRLIGTAAVLLALIVGLDRLLIGAHTVTDVIAGYLLGASVVLTMAFLFDPSPKLIAGTTPLAAQARQGKLAVILNPIKVENPAAFQSIVEDLAERSGYDKPDWYYTTVEDPGRSMAEAAAVNGADLVLVCGGDGTVRTVCGELAGTGIPVGVVPAGTGNLLARNLGLPLYLRSAVDVGLNGQDRAIDVISFSGDGIGEHEHFLVMAGMGLDAAIMEGVNDDLKAKVGALAYVVAGAKNVMSPPIRAEIRIDDGEWTKHRARAILLGNVGDIQGGLSLMPDASVDDGLVDVVLINPRRLWSWIRVLLRVVTRSRHSDSTVNRMTGRSISVRAEKPTPREVDGDSIGSGHELHCQCLPGKLLIRVPR